MKEILSYLLVSDVIEIRILKIYFENVSTK